MTNQMLSLFPLSTVLFPGAYISLQVFEPRYLRLISQCLRRDEPLGIVTLRKGREVMASVQDSIEYEDIGCAASIADWTQRDNGLLAVVLRGEREFSVSSRQVAEDGLHGAVVEYLPQLVDEPVDEVVAPLYSVLLALLEHPSQQPMAEAYRVQGESPQSLMALTNGLAQLLPASLDTRYEWLAEPDLQLRLRAVTRHLEALQSQ